MLSNIEKGNQLEDAVKAIETVILKESSKFSEDSIKIHGKKILSVNGVKHEIDVYVEVSHAPGYESIFIFECKNWKGKVGKNEIIVFSEKIAVSCASRGYFIAKKFTRDAKAQAKKDPRIMLLTAYYYTPIGRTKFPNLNFINTIESRSNVTMLLFGEKTGVKRVSTQGKKIIEIGVPHEAQNFIHDLVENTLNTFAMRYPEGTHKLEFSHLYEYEMGQLFLDSESIRSIEINVVASIEKIVASVISTYDVSSRGRSIMVGVDSNMLSLRAQIIELTNA